MNRNIYLALVAILLLSACQNLRPKMEEEAPVGLNEETQTEELAKTFSCDMIHDSGLRENCVQDVNETIARVLESEIHRTFDLARCVELEGFAIEECKEGIQQSGVTGLVTLAEYDAMREALRPADEVDTPEGEEGGDSALAPKWDLARCNEVTVALKEYCKNEMTRMMEEDLLFEIIASKDSSRCAELTVQEMKDQCEQEFGIFVESEPAGPDDLPVDEPAAVTDDEIAGDNDPVAPTGLLPFQIAE